MTPTRENPTCARPRAPAAYPARPKCFAARFTRALIRQSAAIELGPAVCWMLTRLAQAEEDAQYRRPVALLNDQLAYACGFSLKQLKRARAAAVAAGWLHYLPGRRGVAPKYWVTIPDYTPGSGDLPSDEGVGAVLRPD